MNFGRTLLSCCAALALTACGEASLDNLIEQLSAPGNVPALSKSCPLPMGSTLNPAVHSAYLFEYEDFNVLRIANAGLSCGEALVQPEGVGEGCPIPRSTWQADIGLPKVMPYLDTPISVHKYPSHFHGLAVGHNYCGGNVFPMFSAESTLLMRSTGPECLVAEFGNVPKVGIIGNEQPDEYVDLNGAFPVQRCVAKSPEIGISFEFELAKAQAAKTPPLPL